MRAATTPPMLVLAGGFGSRLRSVVAHVPKPMAPAGAHPFLHYLIEHWVRGGTTRFVFLLHHQANVIEEYLDAARREGPLHGCEVQTVTEETPLGTGGAIANAVQRLGLRDSFLVANGDTWLGGSLAEIANASAPAIAAVRVAETGRYGRLSVEHGRVMAFEEKTTSSGPGLINAGVYHLDAAAFTPWDGAPFSVERDMFPRLVNERRLRALVVDGDFVDIGVPDDYFRFSRWAESGRRDDL